MSDDGSVGTSNSSHSNHYYGRVRNYLGTRHSSSSDSSCSGTSGAALCCVVTAIAATGLCNSTNLAAGNCCPTTSAAIATPAVVGALICGIGCGAAAKTYYQNRATEQPQAPAAPAAVTMTDRVAAQRQTSPDIEMSRV